jgi:hypothetical protein
MGKRHGNDGGKTVIVVGGAGGLFDRYRAIVEKHGYSLQHYEQRVPAGARRAVGRGLLVIMASMVSHSLRDQALSLAGEGTEVVYLRSPSVSALRSAVEQWAA